MQSRSISVWLRAASTIVIGFGVLIALSSYPPAGFATGFLIDLIFWPIDGAQDISQPATRFVFAVSGGVMIGWGLLLWQIVTRLLPKDPSLARSMILASVGIWFVTDSLASVVAGAPLNALLNVPFLLIFALPLWRNPEAAQLMETRA